MDFEKLKREEEEAIAMMTGKPKEENPLEVKDEDFTEAPSEEKVESDKVVEKPTEEDAAFWKKRFTNFKSTADVKLFENRKTIAFQKSVIADLEEERDALKADIDKLKAQLSNAVDPFKDIFTAEDEDTIGPEAVEIIKKAMKAKGGTDEKYDKLEAELRAIKKEKREKMKKDYESMQSQSFEDLKVKLSTVVPDWETIDREAKFGEFIKEVDPISGSLRSKLFANAIENGDVYNVARFYKEYKALKPKTKEEVLAAQVTPVSGGSESTTKSSQDTKRYTIREYKEFMDDLAKGRYRHKMKEAKIKERQFDLAWQQGRLIE